MAIVAGVDFGTLERARLDRGQRTRTAGFGSRELSAAPEAGRPGACHAVARGPHARPRRSDTRSSEEVRCERVTAVEAIAIDTTGSSVIPVGKDMAPLDEYYLWCDHRAKGEAAEITEAARREGLEAIQWCGGVYSSEWGFSKLLHWLRHNPEKRGEFVTAFEHCDFVAATLCGITDPTTGEAQHLRDGPQVDVECVARRTAAGGSSWSGVDPLLAGVREKLQGEYATSEQIAGTLSA